MTGEDSSAPRRRAVALQYRKGEDPAPKVAAKGTGLLADRILELAEQYNVPIYHDPDLVEVLAGLDLDQIIPPDLYKAVAEILAWVYTVNQNLSAENVKY